MNLPEVPYEIAKELKELGFDWFTKNSWYADGVMCETGPDKDCYAPTQAEVCKWFRDKHEIFIEPVKTTDLEKFDCNVTRGSSLYITRGTHDTYEQAELAGIKRSIEILKERS